jgi:hypothetical protein
MVPDTLMHPGKNHLQLSCWTAPVAPASPDADALSFPPEQRVDTPTLDEVQRTG